MVLTEHPPKDEEVALARCPLCMGLRSISVRNRGSSALCRDCREGNVVPVAAFFDWWTARFTIEEIRAMGKAIWG